MLGGLEQVTNSGQMELDPIVSHCQSNWQFRHYTETGAGWPHGGAGLFDGRKTVQKLREREARFHAGERISSACMYAVAECKVTIGSAGDIQRVRVREFALVMICGRNSDMNKSAGRQGLAVDDNLCLSAAVTHL